MKKHKKVLLNIALPFAGLMLFVAVWAIAARIMDKALILPSPREVIRSLGELLKDSAFYKAAGNTLLRSLKGYALAFALALVFATAASFSKIFERIFSPLVTIARAVPTMSVILLALVWLTESSAPVFVAFLIIFPLLYTGMLDAVSRVDGGLIDMSKVFKVRRRDMLSKLYVRETLPSVFTLLQSTLPFNLKLTIAGEVLAQTSMSMGLFMQRSSAYLDTASLLAWTLIAILLGYILELIVLSCRKLTVRWEAKNEN